MYYAPFKILSNSAYLCIRIPTSLVSSFIVLFARFICGSRRFRKNYTDSDRVPVVEIWKNKAEKRRNFMKYLTNVDCLEFYNYNSSMH